MAEVGELSFESLTFGGDGGDDDREENESFDKSEGTGEEEKYVMFISAEDYNDKLNPQTVMKIAEAFGPLKTTNFREKQSFGFLQFNEEVAYEKALEKLNGLELDGTRLSVERVRRITPGRDPRTHNPNSEFKTATLVLKNLPFQLKQEKLEELLTSYEVKPLNVSYLYDGTGMFRGMAFVKYKEVEHAAKVFGKLNGYDISGRKIRVEYKRLVKEPENAADEEKKLGDALKSFNTNPQLHELAFPAGSSYQKKTLRQIAEKMGLGHFTSGDFIVIKKKDDHRTEHRDIPKKQQHDTEHKSDSFKDKGKPIQGRRRTGSESNPRNSFGASPDDKFMSASPHKFSGDKQMSSSRSVGTSPFMKPMTLTAVSPSSLGTSPTYKNSVAILHRIEGGGMQPIRQPRGPDGSNGFSEEYQKNRAKSLK